jgi:hypothetical protein
MKTAEHACRPFERYVVHLAVEMLFPCSFDSRARPDPSRRNAALHHYRGLNFDSLPPSLSADYSPLVKEGVEDPPDVWSDGTWGDVRAPRQTWVRMAELLACSIQAGLVSD